MRTGVGSRRIGKSGSAALRSQQLGADAQRIIGGMADAEHPLVAAHGAHAAAHLVGQGLEAERVVGGGQGAGDRGARPARAPAREEDVDRLLEPALQQMRCSRRTGCSARAAASGLAREVEAVDGVEEEQRAHALVEVVAGAAEAVERVALGQQLFERGIAADGIERAVAFVGIAGGDDRRSGGSSAALLRGRHFADGEQFQHLRQHFGAVASVERQRQLRDQQAVARADIVAAVRLFEREVLLVARQFVERGRERWRAPCVAEVSPSPSA